MSVHTSLISFRDIHLYLPDLNFMFAVTFVTFARYFAFSPRDIHFCPLRLSSVQRSRQTRLLVEFELIVRRYVAVTHLHGLLCILSRDRHVWHTMHIDRQMSDTGSRSRKKSGKNLGFSTVRNKRQARVASPWNIIAKTSRINSVLLARAKRGSSITGQLDNGLSTVDFYPSLLDVRFCLKNALAAIFIRHYARDTGVCKFCPPGWKSCGSFFFLF